MAIDETLRSAGALGKLWPSFKTARRGRRLSLPRTSSKPVSRATPLSCQSGPGSFRLDQGLQPAAASADLLPCFLSRLAAVAVAVQPPFFDLPRFVKTTSQNGKVCPPLSALLSLVHPPASRLRTKAARIHLLRARHPTPPSLVSSESRGSAAADILPEAGERRKRDRDSPSLSLDLTQNLVD